MNKKLAQHAYELALEQGADASFLDLSDYSMPGTMVTWKLPVSPSTKPFIATPEYSGFLSSLLKNTIDWVSRPEPEGEPRLVVLRGKIAALVAAAPGRNAADPVVNITVHVMGLLTCHSLLWSSLQRRWPVG